jgi:hypothetical protein
MDRRGFLAGVGTLGAAATGGWATMEVAARAARADGLAKAAGGQAPGSKAAEGLVATPSLTVGYLPGSAGLLEYAARSWDFPQLSTQMRWAQWEPSLALPILDSRVDVGIGMLRHANVFAPSALLSLEVVAHFALDQSPYFAPFNAWQYTAARPGKPAKATSPLMFEAAMPDRVGLQVNYAMERTQTLSRMAAGGTVYLPIGGRGGAGTGIYVLATPSRVNGNPPVFGDFAFSGDLNQPLWRFDGGGSPEFDFVTVTIAPVVT